MRGSFLEVTYPTVEDMLVFRRVYILPIGSLLYMLLNLLPEAPKSMDHVFSNLARFREIAITGRIFCRKPNGTIHTLLTLDA